MKKIVLTLLALLLVVPTTFGQLTKFSRFTDSEASVVLGRPFKASTREMPKKYIGQENGNHIFLSIVYDRFLPFGNQQLERVDERMTMTRKQGVKPKVDGRSVNVLRGLQMNTGLYLVGTATKPSEKKSMLYAIKLDSEKMALGDFIELADVDYSGGKRSESKEFKFAFAPDTSKLLVYYNIPGKKEDFENFGFKVFDRNLEIIHDLQVQIPYSEKLFNILEVAVDNDGTIYCAGKLYAGSRRESKKGNVNYTTKILIFKGGADTPEELNLAFDDVFISSLKMSFRGNMISVVGFFSDYSSIGEKGVFVMDVDKKKAEVVSQNLKFFDKNFFALGLSKKEKEKLEKRDKKGKDISFNEFLIDHIIPYSDGSFTIVAEQRYIRVVETSNGNGGSRTDYYYHNHHVLVFKVNKDNEIDWYSKVIKSQITRNDGGFSNGYVMIPTEKALYFLFNEGHKAYDPKKNKEPGFTSTYSRKKKSVVSLTTIALADGTPKRVKVMDGKTDKFLLIPTGTTVSNGSIITNFFNSKQRRYGSLTVTGMLDY